MIAAALSKRLFPASLLVMMAGSVAGTDMAFGMEEKPATGKDKEKVVGVLDNIISTDRLPEASGWRVREDSVLAGDSASRYSGLTDADFELVATELGVEIAAIKAVVAIEAGSQMKGFWAPGVPVVNFDNTLYSRFRRKVKSGGSKDAEMPKGLKGYAHREWSQLTNARKVNECAADMGTFWGMFQIGGFNYSKCGCETLEEFVRLMSYSELEQLELFAAFIRNAGMLEDLKKKNWAGFARKYNGSGYARRGYHTKMAAAYKRFKAQEK